MKWATLLLLTVASGFAAPTPPAQPATGPGSSAYPHSRVSVSIHGEGGTQYHLFEPAAPAPAQAPVIVFLHGWTAIDPWLYGAWIEHLVKRGNVVIYPRWQANYFTPPAEFAANTLKAVADARTELSKPGHTPVNWGQFAVVGHSVGGLLTASLGALAKEKSLPQPKALMCVQPGRSARGRGWGVPLPDLSRIPAETLLLCVTGERDNVCGATDALRIYKESTTVPAAQKSVIEQPLDVRGPHRLSASHLAPCSVPAEPPGAPIAEKLQSPSAAALIAAAGGDFTQVRQFLSTPEGRLWRREKLTEVSIGETFAFPDAQDYALWRLFDALCAAAFSSSPAPRALPITADTLHMGTWSDGSPAKPMRVIK